MTSGRIPRLRAPALTITILFTTLALSFALLGSLALADDTTTVPSEAPAEDAEATQAAPCTATASTSLRAHQPGDAVDGSRSTHWAAISRNYPQWLMVDLGAPQRVVKSSISWLRLEKSRKYFYRLEGSVDGQEWQLLADRTKKSAYNHTNDKLDVEVQYLRVTVLGANRGRAGIKEIKVKRDTTEGDEWVVVTPTPEPSPEPTDTGDEWAVVTPTPTPTPADSPTPIPSSPSTTDALAITGLSQSCARVGASLTITGKGFGVSQGDSKVTFGERLNEQGWAPCARTASIDAWSDTRIVCTVPAMSPGKANAPGTYHPVYATVGGQTSNSVNFYIEPVTTITTGTAAAVANAVIPASNSTWISATATFSSRNAYGIMPVDGAVDVLFDGVTFTNANETLSGTGFGVLTLGQFRNTHRRLTFVNCTFTGNTGVGSGADYGVNGVKMWTGSNDHDRVYDVSFVDCRFGEYSRMSYEQVNQEGGACAMRMALIDCVFEPSGGEVISFGSTGSTYSLVSGCTLKGAGNRAEPQWEYCFECNQTRYVEFRDSEIWHWRSVCFNMNGDNEVESNILVKNVDVDFSHTYQTYLCPNGKGLLFELGETSHVRFADCTFNTGDADTYLGAAGSASPDWVAPNFRSCRYNDFSGSTISGYVTANTWPVRAVVPDSAEGYWDHPDDIHESNIIPELMK